MNLFHQPRVKAYCDARGRPAINPVRGSKPAKHPCQRLVKPLCFILASVFIITQISGMAFAGFVVAELKNIKGNVKIQKHGVPPMQPATNNMTLYAKDIVMTSKGAEAEIVFKDGHVVKVTQLSTIQIKVPRPATKKDSAGSNPVSDIKCSIGKIFVKAKKSISKDTQFEVATPTAVVGVRGTLFAVAVDENGDTSCSVKEGNVEVFNDTETLLMDAGEQIMIDAQTGDIPDEPSPMSNEEEKEWGNQKDLTESNTLEGKNNETGTVDKETVKTDAEKTETVSTVEKKETTSIDEKTEPVVTDSGTKSQDTSEVSTPLEQIIPQNEYSPTNEITEDTDLIKNLEAENTGVIFEPAAETNIIPPPSPEEIKAGIENSIQGSVTQQDNFGAAAFDEETFSQ